MAVTSVNPPPPPSKQFHAKVVDIDIHRRLLIVEAQDAPQYLHRMFLSPMDFQRFHINDEIDVKYISTSYSGTWEVIAHYPSPNPGNPTYEKVDNGQWYDKYLCCSKAIKSDTFCVCSAVIECDIHGVKHHGTHD